jgi:ribosome maturation factor RimP
MSNTGSIKERIMERLTEAVAAFGVDLIDVETLRENERRILRLIIDRRGGVDIETCVKVSEMADPVISDELGIDTHDFFEVSSAGLDRKLQTTADLQRHIGAEVDLKLYRALDGKKVIEGVLEDATDEKVTIRLDDESVIDIERKSAAAIRRGIRF